MEVESPPITALAVRGETVFAGTSGGDLLANRMLVAEVSAQQIVALAPYAGGVAFIDETGVIAAISDVGARCELMTIDEVKAADGGPARMAIARSGEVVELLFSEGGQCR